MAAKTPIYDDDTEYLVKLTVPVLYRGSPLLPLPVHEMTGRTLNAIIEQEGTSDVIDRADPRT